jgi:hypothetical protein
VSPELRLIGVLGRITAATSAIRVRSADAVRAESNGGSSAELRKRLELVVVRLEAVADELEGALK